MSPPLDELDQDVATCLGGDFWEYVEARPCIPGVKKPAVDLFKRQNHEEVTLRQLTAFLLFTEWKGDFTASSQGVQCSECEGELVVTTQRVLFFNEGPKNPVPLACMPVAVVDRVIKLQNTRVISTKAGQLKLLQIQCEAKPVRCGPHPVILSSCRLLVSVSGKDLRTVVFGFSRSNHGARGAALDSILHSVNLLQTTWCPHPLQSCTPPDHSVLDDEYQRLLRLGNADLWRMSGANESYGLCPTYPSTLILPASVSDEDVLQAATFRARGRLPAFCWQHPRSGAVLSRSGQPKVGFMQSSRSDADEALVAALGASGPNGEKRKLVIADARPRKNALANGALGGGSEPRGHYRCSEVVYLGIDNIHAVRESAQKLREYLEQFGSSQTVSVALRNGGSWGGGWGVSTAAAAEALVSTSWLQHVHKLLCGAAFIAAQICVEGASVLVHCSDGWDRTPSLLCCALVLLDPHYRTRTGFRALVELHWAAFGHQFAERMGSTAPEGSAAPSAAYPGSNNHSPIFLQWIDCMAQLLRLYPTAFQYSTTFLVTFLDLVLSCRFHNFLCNSEAERVHCGVRHRFACIWEHLGEVESSNGGAFRNPLYCPALHPDALLPSAAALSPLLVPALYLRWSCPRGGLECRGEHTAACGGVVEDAVRAKVHRLAWLDLELAELRKRSEALSLTLECTRREGDKAREGERQALRENSVLRQQLAAVGAITSLSGAQSASEQMVSLSITDRGGGRTCSDRLCKGCDSDGFSVDFHALRQPVKEAHFVATPAQNRSLSVS